jgi:hypothetical protein
VATRKQRRRREKEQRHEYVWEDSEGNVLDPTEVRAGSNGAPSKPARGGGGGGGRQLQPPSWRRTIKRGLIFAPIFLGVVLLLNGEQGLGFAVVNTLFLLAVFVPFSYVIDKVMWRSFQKRAARADASSSGKR